MCNPQAVKHVTAVFFLHPDEPDVEPERCEIVLEVFETAAFTGVLSGRPDL